MGEKTEIISKSYLSLCYVKDDALKAELKECSGIGTEATRAGIIEKLQDNGFLELAGKFFAPTEKARMAVRILPDEMIYPDTTALWEKELEEVAVGKKSFEQFYRSQLSGLSKSTLIRAVNAYRANIALQKSSSKG